MITGKEESLENVGKLILAFSDPSGSSVGVEFSSTTQKQATAIMGICASTFGDSTSRLVTSSSTSDTSSKSSDGGNDMEKRIAILEAEVAHIKSGVADLKDDAKKIRDDVAATSRDMAVVLQKLVDIDGNLSKKASTAEMSSAISSAANKQIAWTIATAFAILGVAKYIF